MPDEFERDSLSGVKDYGEGATEAKNPLAGGAWGPLPALDEGTFDSVWGQRSTTSQTTTQGSLEAPVQGVAPSGNVTGGVAAFAKQFIGTPYKWGGNGPLGFDCSGFTSYVMKQFGVTLPRVSYQQGQGGSAVSKDDLQPGDLVFWDNSSRNNGADHVAIYIGNGQIAEAPQPGGRVQVRALGNFGWARRYTSETGVTPDVGALGVANRQAASSQKRARAQSAPARPVQLARRSGGNRAV